jgi:hypothetical protein
LVDRQADVVEDAAQRAFGDVTIAVDWNGGSASVGCRMMWWLPLTLAISKP